MAFHEVARSDEIKEGQMIMVTVASRDILLAKIEGTIYAMDDHCAHLGAPLHEGTLNGSLVGCPLHSVHYDVKTGEYVGQRDFQNYDRESFQVEVLDGIVKVDVPGS